MKVCSKSFYEEYEFVNNYKNNLRWYDFILMLLFATLPIIVAYCACSINYCEQYHYYGENGEYWENPIEMYITPFYYGAIRFIYPFNIELGTYNAVMSIYLIACGFAISFTLIQIYCKYRFRDDSPAFRKEFTTMAVMDTFKASTILTAIVVFDVFTILFDGYHRSGVLIDLILIVITSVVLILRYFIYYRIYKLTAYERT